MRTQTGPAVGGGDYNRTHDRRPVRARRDRPAGPRERRGAGPSAGRGPRPRGPGPLGGRPRHDPTGGPDGAGHAGWATCWSAPAGRAPQACRTSDLGADRIARGTGVTATVNALADVLGLQHRLAVSRRPSYGPATAEVLIRTTRRSPASAGTGISCTSAIGVVDCGFRGRQGGQTATRPAAAVWRGRGDGRRGGAHAPCRTPAAPRRETCLAATSGPAEATNTACAPSGPASRSGRERVETIQVGAGADRRRLRPTPAPSWKGCEEALGALRSPSSRAPRSASSTPRRPSDRPQGDPAREVRSRPSSPRPTGARRPRRRRPASQPRPRPSARHLHECAPPTASVRAAPTVWLVGSSRGRATSPTCAARCTHARREQRGGRRVMAGAACRRSSLRRGSAAARKGGTPDLHRAQSAVRGPPTCSRPLLPQHAPDDH